MPPDDDSTAGTCSGSSLSHTWNDESDHDNHHLNDGGVSCLQRAVLLGRAIATMRARITQRHHRVHLRTGIHVRLQHLPVQIKHPRTANATHRTVNSAAVDVDAGSIEFFVL